MKVKNGEAVYERDSFLFEQVQYSWALLSALYRCALEHNAQLSVIDFGGSLGSSYFQNRNELTTIKKIDWSVVEQQNFVEVVRYCRQYLTTSIIQLMNALHSVSSNFYCYQACCNVLKNRLK